MHNEFLYGCPWDADERLQAKKPSSDEMDIVLSIFNERLFDSLRADERDLVQRLLFTYETFEQYVVHTVGMYATDDKAYKHVPGFVELEVDYNPFDEDENEDE